MTDQMLQEKALQLDNVQNILQNGLFPGQRAQHVVKAQLFIHAEWMKIQELLPKEGDSEPQAMPPIKKAKKVKRG